MFSYRLFNIKTSARTVAQASVPAHSMICHQCDLRSQLPQLKPGMEARCPRCGELLCAIAYAPYEGPLAWGVSALCFLMLSCSFPFLSMSVQGHVSEISLLQSAETLIEQDFRLLAQLLVLFVLLMPAVFLFVLICVFRFAFFLFIFGYFLDYWWQFILGDAVRDSTDDFTQYFGTKTLGKIGTRRHA